MTKKILEKLDDASMFWLLRTVVAKDIVMSSNKRKNFSWWKYCKFVVSVDNTIYPVYWAISALSKPLSLTYQTWSYTAAPRTKWNTTPP